MIPSAYFFLYKENNRQAEQKTSTPKNSTDKKLVQFVEEKRPLESLTSPESGTPNSSSLLEQTITTKVPGGTRSITTYNGRTFSEFIPDNWPFIGRPDSQIGSPTPPETIAKHPEGIQGTTTLEHGKEITVTKTLDRTIISTKRNGKEIYFESFPNSWGSLA